MRFRLALLSNLFSTVSSGDSFSPANPLGRTFPTVFQPVTETEEQAMLDKFWEFDRNMIHDKYKAVVGEYETK